MAAIKISAFDMKNQAVIEGAPDHPLTSSEGPLAANKQTSKFTEDRPKCMIPVLGDPLLSLQIKLLRLHGVKKITLRCGKNHELIRDYFGDDSKHQVEINYLVEETALGYGLQPGCAGSSR